MKTEIICLSEVNHLNAVICLGDFWLKNICTYLQYIYTIFIIHIFEREKNAYNRKKLTNS